MSARNASRWGWVAFAMLGMLVLGLLGASSPALAFTGYSAPTFFGAAGSGNGQFKEPAGVAVNNTTKEVYVYDSGNLRVQRFGSTGGKFEGQFNGGGPTGQFTAPASISEHAAHGTLFNLAVDNDPSSPSVGDVYVVDPGHNVIDKFTPAGVYLSQLSGFKATVFGVAVDTSGNVWVAEEGNSVTGRSPENIGPVQEFDSSVVNKHVSELSPEALRSPGIALDSEQNLFLLRGEPNVVKFNKEGATLDELATSCGCLTALAVDSSTNDLFADQGSSIARYKAPVEGEPSPLETLTGLSASYGVAVNAATHLLYASQREANTVAIFNFGLLPDVSTGAASEIHRTTAKLAGEVNPDGQEVTSCEFEYGPTEAYGKTVACSLAPGSGTSPVAVSAEATGLTPQNTYHFRLVAGNSNGTHPGSDSEFTTPPAVESVLTEAALAVTATTATLQGSFEPNGFDTHYQFEYRSLTGSPAVTPLQDAGSASEDKHVSAEVAGLTPNALYLFRTLAENQFGQTLGGFQFFKTPVIAPVISGSPSASFIAAQSAVLNAKLNPEHTMTRYHFEYGACPTLTGCASVQSTADETSGVYGEIGATQEIAGLAPQTTYSYRLLASNRHIASCEGGNPIEEEGAIVGCEGGVPVFAGGEATGTESTFTTGAATLPSAETGGHSADTATGAVISGMVNPDGLPASYAFELGVYEGAGTQYAVVFSGSAGTGTTPIEQTLALTGLQPGTTYAYRITVSSGYIPNESHTLQGATATFTTGGLPTVLTPPAAMAQLLIPSIAFPPTTGTVVTRTKALTNAQKLAKALKLCKKDRSRAQKAKCEKGAHRKYGPVKKSKKK
jgi:phosphodiesterase/alkaline phosphatase D-like protein